MKSFRDEFYKILNRIKTKEPFAFSRWADGELFILQGKSYSLSPSSHGYLNSEDQKNFHAERDNIVTEKLWDALRYGSENYYIGIITNGDMPPENHGGFSTRDWMIEESGSALDNVTFANVLINSNYTRYREEMLPLYKDYKMVTLCNEKCSLDDSLFDSVVKDFRVGSNCIVSDLDKVEEMVEWVRETKPEGHLFLFAASSLGNMCIHKLHEVAPNNTYIDVGSSLNPDFKLSCDRGYLCAWNKELWRGYLDTSQDIVRGETW